jgi:stage V sporulation protein B
MRDRIITIARDPFLINNAVYFFGSLFVAVLNYLYHPLLSRLLSVDSFGDLETIIVIYAQISTVLGVFGKVVINTIAQQSSEIKEAVMIRELYSLAAAIIGGTALLLLVFCFPITAAFHFNSVYSVLVLALLVLLSIPSTFQSSILQGIQDFKTVSINSAIQAGGKLIFAVFFVLIGFGLTGAILALAVAQVATVLYGYFKTREHFSLRLTHLPHKELFKKEIPYAFLILVTGVAITMLYNSDIAFVKYFFSGETTGLYSGISIIDNVLFFITASVAGVLLPAIKKHESFASNNVTFMKALGITLLVGVPVMILFCAFPSFIVDVMIGGKYLSFSKYLPPLSVMVFMVSLSNLFVAFFLALRKYALIPISLFGIIVLLCAITVLHGSIAGIITSFVLGSGVTLFLLVAYYLYYAIHERRLIRTA